MQPNTTENTPAFDGAYVPYFYERGLYLWYPLGTEGPGKSPSSAPYAIYDFSSDRASSRHLDHPQTVEQIIAHGYLAVPQGDPTTALISDRKHTSWLGLDDIINQVRQRYEVYHKNSYELELAKCAASNAIFSIESDRGGMPANSKEVYGRDKKLQEIYQEQREERVNLWRDVSRLKLSLPEIAQMYLGAYRKSYLLQSVTGDSP